MSGNAMARFWLGTMLSILWTGLSAGDAIAPADVDAGLWQRVVLRLKANGLSRESIEACMRPVQEAASQGLPADPVLTRVEEGAAKGVEGTALQAAAHQRLSTLQSAATVLRQAGYVDRNAVNDQLMKSVTLALESGLSADTLRGVLALAKGGQADRMRNVIEAGETMRLSGMDAATVGPMMIDFTERNLRRTEIIRASRYAVKQHEAHVEGTRIRKQLWDGNGTGGRWGRGQNPPGAAGPGADDPVRGNGPAGSGTTSGQGRRSPSPGNEPAAPGPGGGGPGGGGPGGGGPGGGGPGGGGPGGGGPGGGGNGGSNGSGGQEGAGSADTTPLRRP
jgi:hypothetical protein